MRRPFDFDDLHPIARDHFKALTNDLLREHRAGRLEYELRPFEGLRDLDWQNEMVRRGVSKAKAWSSAHQYGLAVDFVPWSPGMGWHWPKADHKDWSMLGILASNRGLVRAIAWDKPHVHHPAWDLIRRHLL